MISRQRLTVRGIVQGVGFRPFVYRLAQELGLSGWVRNDGAGVSIEAEGETDNLLVLKQRLREEAPPRAQFDSLQIEDILPVRAANDSFRILESQTDAKGQFDAAIGPDSGICDNCLKELFDPANRRYRYAFINCTDCGPRYTIAKRLPYTREKTSMAKFTQCPNCQSEYDDPAQRRFHAEPNACPVCGPKLSLLDAKGQAIAGDPITETLKCLQAGEIVAIKGLGGFHLACDARNAEAVARLRERKHREEKPLALMFASPTATQQYVELSYGEAAQMMVPERPILLLPKREICDRTFSGVAPGIAWLGVMLPYTPLHYLLFHEAAGRPKGTEWLFESHAQKQAHVPELALVMTSANPHGEPLVKDNEEALSRLSHIADAYLLHDRDIVARCDDTVIRVQPSTQQSQFIRRARGYTPRAIPLSQKGPDVLALGGLFKNTLCFTRRQQAFLSPHIGDLSNAATRLAQEEAVDHLHHILEVQPQAIAHDMHPDFFSTHLAMQLGAKWNVPTVAVQHHHAHIAAVMAEHRISGPVLGLALDGVGLGDDGSAWGGELLRVDGARYERLGHLRQLPLPGGDRAAREPWRMGAAALHLLGRWDEIARRYADQKNASMLSQLLNGTMRLQLTSSMGRWFDAAAGLLGVQAIMTFEGQAAMRLEGLAASYGKVAPILEHQLLDEHGQSVLDLLPLLARIGNERDKARGAALFHAGLIAALADWVQEAAQSSGLHTVVCGGGCFLNAILADGLRKALEARGLTMLEAQGVPPGDGGLSLGQAWIAREALQNEITK